MIDSASSSSDEAEEKEEEKKKGTTSSTKKTKTTEKNQEEEEKERERDGNPFSIELYNKSVEKIFSSKSFIKSFKFQYDLGRNMRWFLTWFSVTVSSLSPSHLSLSEEDFSQSLSTLTRDRKVESVRNTTTIELCLLASLLQLEKKERERINFCIVYQEYSNYLYNSSKLQSVNRYPKNVCLKAFEHLCELGLVSISPLGAGGNGTGEVALSLSGSFVEKEYEPCVLAVDPLSLVNLVKQLKDCPTWLKNWIAGYTH